MVRLQKNQSIDFNKTCFCLGLLFTYGITSSGKTYTITGSPQNCGILPRTLDVVFNSIDSLQSRKFIFKPDGQNYFTILSTPDALLEWQKEKSMPKTPQTPFSRTPRSRRKENDNDFSWDTRIKDSGKIEVNENYNYAVFVSYVEVYNNYIYDLLDDSFVDALKLKQPQSKVLREDSKRRIFVYGGTEIEVKSAEEAFDMFIKGVRRRRIAHTNLNTESSRSHSVFSIRVVQAPLDLEGEIIADDNHLIVSQLSLVDLAGSERTVRTKNTGDRLREAGNINNSLMGLRNCIEILRENQRTGVNKMVPYRDNKLTHLFKSYFEGEGKIRMIICVNPRSEDYDETLHVMKFAELSQDVMIARAGEILFRKRETLPKYSDLKGLDFATSATFGPIFPNNHFIDPNDEKVIPDWLECLHARKENRDGKMEQLRRMQLDFRQNLMDVEKENMFLKQQVTVLNMDLEAREQQVKGYEDRFSQADRITETQARRIHGLESQIRSLENEKEEKERLLSQVELEKERIKTKTRDRLDSEKERIKRIFEGLLAEKQAQLEREQCLSQEKMHLVREILNADNTNWEILRDHREGLLPSHNNPIQGKLQTPPPVQYKPNFKTPVQQTPRASSFHPGKIGTPVTIMSEMKTNTDGSNQSGLNSNFSSPCNAPPVINPRHLRSLSSGNEKWIDHRPAGTLNLGTVLRPKIKNKKSLSNLKSATVLKDASKYALTHHNATANGEVETSVYKGEIIPSVSGGTQVIFNDVETLRQGSPPGR